MSSVPDASFTATASPTKTSSVASEPPLADRTREVRVRGGRFARRGVPEPRASDAQAGDGAGHALGARLQRHVLELGVGVDADASSDANDARSKTPLAKVLRRWC